ncbi:MAG TPA: caspase family protein [Kofleriaceae bacterium]|nr:caspase family protein [Kofleriaceae bacterium]
MPHAISLHLGLNAVDANVYRGWSGPLRGCENDAHAMQAIADAQGFTSRLLLGADATRPNLLAAMDRAAADLAAGDLLLLTYSGHGASRPDHNGDEPDRRDEAWCLHDGLLLDDEIHHRLCAFAAGVRVLVVSDSCSSGSVTRDDQTHPTTTRVRRPAALRNGSAATPDRRAPGARVRAVLRANADEYAARKAAVAATQKVEPTAGIILLAACEDFQTAHEGERHGLFTEALLATWNGGAFAGGHEAFLAAIRTRVGDAQTPTLFTVGAVESAFRASRPFTP